MAIIALITPTDSLTYGKYHVFMGFLYIIHL
jgi:hypothetical protein